MQSNLWEMGNATWVVINKKVTIFISYPISVTARTIPKSYKNGGERQYSSQLIGSVQQEVGERQHWATMLQITEESSGDMVFNISSKGLHSITSVERKTYQVLKP